MTLLWWVLAAVLLALLVARVVQAVRRDGYGQRTPPRVPPWTADDLPSVPYRQRWR